MGATLNPDPSQVIGLCRAGNQLPLLLEKFDESSDVLLRDFLIQLTELPM